MKNLFAFLLLFSSLSVFSQSQASENEKTSQAYMKADKELNQVYQQILKEYKSDKVFIASLKKAQQAWIAFRDAEVAANYPAKNGMQAYGSAFPMCWNLTLAELTKERTAKLKVWITGIPEGDVCNGSVKVAK
ncbi:lysozyme inhibitor LprI family protein [uncultured Flavobacterium sp.]|uniref:lysozyme inhibitor LprI family protein n=1 Tax=uncultured Flavobacterium sp. TaxID=165435 RepID=UPI0025E757D0|nr:lysozyme inhibitor LprI family protein [uncultured Flavobacterium sp.]